jgi:hypothetical protein
MQASSVPACGLHKPLRGSNFASRSATQQKTRRNAAGLISWRPHGDWRCRRTGHRGFALALRAPLLRPQTASVEPRFEPEALLQAAMKKPPLLAAISWRPHGDWCRGGIAARPMQGIVRSGLRPSQTPAGFELRFAKRHLTKNPPECGGFNIVASPRGGVPVAF